MNCRTMRFLLFWLSAALLLAACDTGPPRSDTDGTQPGTTPGSTVDLTPSLIRIDGASSPVGPGDVITLVGLNFSPVLSENVVLFEAGNNTVEGLVLNVVQVGTSTQGSTENNMDVVIPGGVSRGTVALRVRGNDAGGVAGFDVNPSLVGFTLGNNASDSDLGYGPGAVQANGFQDLNSRVTVHGLNFADVREVLLDLSGSSDIRVPSNTFIRNPVQAQAGVEPSGLESFAFNLKDDLNDVRIPLTTNDIAASVGLRLRGSGEVSNRLMIPVFSDAAATDEDRSGAVVSSVNVPVGVVTGPVPVRYTCYERVVGSEWEMQVDFRVSNTSFTSSWTPATPFVHPDSDGKDYNGTTGLYMGSPLHRSGQRLLPGIGARRAFIWDAPNDPVFRQYREEKQENGQLRPRYWKVEFRLTPVSTSQNRLVRMHQAVTPPLVYYDLVDRPGDLVAGQRWAAIDESFDNTLFVDKNLTTAIWGPPVNPGLLSGGTNPPQRDLFGTGTAVVVLQEVDPEGFLDVGETMLDEYVEFNTDRMELIHHVVKLVPNDVDGSLSVVDFTFIELIRDERGALVTNPGKDLGEFHFKSLRLLGGEFPTPAGPRPNVDATNPPRDTVNSRFRMFGRGARPLIIRLSGGDVTASDDAVVVSIEQTEYIYDPDPDVPDDEQPFVNPAIVTVSGSAGGPGSPLLCPCPPNCGLQNGGGGAPGAGGGAGGDGAQVFILYGTLNVIQLADAEPGGNFGGEGGETPAAVDFDETKKSILHGAPGGGGGHRVPGGDGEYGTSTIAQYQTPREGRGGIQRGSPEQLEITAGSGGGGGGASLSRVATAADGPYFTAAGGGGGGGAGAVAFYARGTILVDGRILANGGPGGSGEMPRSPTPPCNPYPAGTDQIATGAPGGGGSGGTIVLRATGEVMVADAANLEVNGGAAGVSRTARTMNRTAGRGVGALGYIRIESGTGAVDYFGDLPVTPAASLSEGGLAASPDALTLGRGQDGVLHLRFIQSIDPLTGSPLRDAETGREVSRWTYNTDTGLLTDPRGDSFRTRTAGIIDVSRLTIDEDVVLRASGTRPLRVSVRETALVEGAIDVSGYPGGALRFEFPGQFPQPGLGGVPGPAGGRGGAGGTVQFAAAATIPVDGQAGGTPLDELETSLPDVLVPLVGQVTPAGAGGTVPGEGGVSAPPSVSAGGGAGGGHLQSGEAGRVPSGSDASLAGQPGSGFGFDSGRFAGELFLYGGLGGGGGGANPKVSEAYANRRIRGSYPFPGVAVYAPGTGGGGGGGVLHLLATTLVLSPSGRLLARGGNAYQSVDLAGNGGAGAGGTIAIQVLRSLEIRPGAVIDASGGQANRLPPFNPEGFRSYEGNIRTRYLDAFPEEFTGVNDNQKLAFGGLGGTGAAGRVRIEAPFVFRGLNPSASTGIFLSDTVQTVGVSQPLVLGLCPTFVARSQYMLDVDVPRLILSALQPPGTDVHLLWEGARQSLDVHAGIGQLLHMVSDPRHLTVSEIVRYRVYFRSDYISRGAQSLQQLRLPYGTDLPDIDF
ncbi:MAG: hypothetical protein JXA90_00875 [Planctomycetes bacterium]|nr:hypothetical protein [Planctomycetota bacterium]